MDSSSDDVVTSTESKTAPLDLATPSDQMRNDSVTEQRVSTRLLQEAIDFALNFLSTSSNEKLAAVCALLTVVTYIVLGRVGLLLIGVALGVILHASWEGTHSHGEEGLQLPRKRRELALEVSKRLLDWPNRVISTKLDTQDKDNGNAATTAEDLSATDLDFKTFRPATAAALRLLTDAVIKDYVKYWYEPILPKESVFPDSCRRTLTYFVTAVSSHLSRKRTEDTFLQFLTNSSSIIIVFLNELAAAFAAGSSSGEAQEIVDQYLENAPDSSLANVLSEEQQRKKLNMIADDILSNFLDAKSYGCSPVRDFLREIFSGVILESTVMSLSRPEFINEWIIYLLEDGESEIMHAIDAGVEGARNQGVEPKNDELASQNTVQQSNHTDKATEEAMLEAKRLSAMIASQDVQGAYKQFAETAQSIEARQSTDETKRSSMQPGNADQKSEVSARAGMMENQLPFTNSKMPSSNPMSHPREDAPAPTLALHGALVMVDDDGAQSEKGTIKSRPTWDYLLQVEPTSTRSTGWMLFRKYSEFQSLHEMLETVSRLNQITSFSERFPILPAWKGQTREALARDLERYLQHAMKHELLAETDRMRRFLEKEVGTSEVPSVKPGFSFPSQSAFENMGKGVLGALTNAPKGVAGGGRAVFDGVTGVFGGVGHSRKPTNSDRQSHHQKTSSQVERELPRSSSSASDINRINPSPAELSLEDHSILSRTSEDERSTQASPPTVSSLSVTTEESPKALSVNDPGNDMGQMVSEQDAWTSVSTPAPSEDRNSFGSIGRGEAVGVKEDSVLALPKSANESESTGEPCSGSQGLRRQRQPITADETQIAVELIFAVINELYTLSSAWNIRRTLLNAAKTYILRPGSPTLETIRELLQNSMIESHTSDDALGEYLKKLRENALPTEDEFKAWPPSPTEQEKAQLRNKARRLFVQRGIPQALTSVMGAAASREALEKIFDSLQVQTVARGFIFSVLLQGLRVLTL
ncbi:hypothetical protein N7526_009796 [Penicillium atrosanguineum]|nr:hypothetical protein N7526_009796 [Penicillium atrosanguineum]